MYMSFRKKEQSSLTRRTLNWQQIFRDLKSKNFWLYNVIRNVYVNRKKEQSSLKENVALAKNFQSLKTEIFFAI